MLLSAVSLAACGPIQVPESNQPARCPRPCPASCPDSCLPSGYCSKITLTEAQLGLPPQSDVEGDNHWSILLPGFPPNQDISFIINGEFDVSEREGEVPFYMKLWIRFEQPFEFSPISLAGTFDQFPIWAAYRDHVMSSDAGVLDIEAVVASCDANVGDPPEPIQAHCFFAPSSTVEGELIDTAPWLSAPLCDP